MIFSITPQEALEPWSEISRVDWAGCPTPDGINYWSTWYYELANLTAGHYQLVSTSWLDRRITDGCGTGQGGPPDMYPAGMFWDTVQDIFVSE